MSRNRTTSRRWSSATLAVTAAVAVLLAPATAGAAPTSAEDAARLVTEAGLQLTALDEQIHQAKLTVAERQQAAAASAQASVDAEAVLAGYAPQLAAIAQTAGTSQSRMATFLTSESAADVVQQMTTLDLIAAHTEGLLAEVSIAQRAAELARAEAEATAAQAAATLAELERQQAEVEARQAQYEADFAALTTAQQAVVTTSLAGPTMAAPDTASVVASAPSRDVGAILEAALAQVGDPYVWGGAGPDGFDCSGLTGFAYAAAGISLPHSSRVQSQMGVAVSRSELQPGDLVFFYSPISHVGIYIGDGKMVHARTFGVPVSVTSVDMAGYVSARRIL